MKNDIGRKITSLTLMTIMIAGGMSFAAPGVMPEAHAQNANLFVSAENSLFQNSFAGPMVIEVVINDPALGSIDEAEAEPDVTINGQDIRMAQAKDGNWYAYFASDVMALAADSQSSNGTDAVGGYALDFGIGCSVTSAIDTDLRGSVSYTEAKGVYFPDNATVANHATTLDANSATLIDCSVANTPSGGNDQFMNVVRENKTLNDDAGAASGPGQLNFGKWPVIQLYTFAVDGTVEVKYNAAGDTQQVNLVYLDDADGFASLVLDRTSYPQSGAVHFTITDLQLNIDPTDEDVWTFTTNSTVQATARDGGTNGTEAFYGLFDENGNTATDSPYVTLAGNTITHNEKRAAHDGQPDSGSIIALNLANLNFDSNGVLILNVDAQNSGTNILTIRDNGDQNLTGTGAITAVEVAGNVFGGGKGAFLSGPVTITETQSNSGIFKNTDEADLSNLVITSDAKRGTSATIDYNDSTQTILVANYFALLDLDESSVGGEWNSGELLAVTLTDQDMNLDSLLDEDLDVNNAAVDVPALTIGSPITFSTLNTVNFSGTDIGASATGTANVDSTSQIVNIGVGTAEIINLSTGHDVLNFTYTTTISEANSFLDNGTTGSTFMYLHYDIRSFSTSAAGLGGTGVTPEIHINLGNTTGNGSDIATDQSTNATSNGYNRATGVSGLDITSPTGTTTYAGLIDITNIDFVDDDSTDPLAIWFNFTGVGGSVTTAAGNYTAVVDLFKFGTDNDGISASDRSNNAIYRMELEETGDNTGVFTGTIEYIMLNQINVNNTATYQGGDFIDDAIIVIVHEDLTDEDAPRLTYADLGADGVITPVSDQQEAPSHSGTVSLDSSSYKIADTVTVTLVDADLNTDSEILDIFTVVDDPADDADETVGINDYGLNTKGEPFGRMLDITFNDAKWTSDPAGTGASTTACGLDAAVDSGLIDTGFTLIETGINTGIFTGDFQIPSAYCNAATTNTSTTGTDLEVNYVDYRDASGETIEVGDSAGIRANTGSVSLDRTVYPVPWGTIADFGDDAGDSKTPGGDSLFPIHASGITDADLDEAAETLGDGDVTIHVRINDPDFDVNPAGQDQIAQLIASDGTAATAERGPLKITVSRGTSEVILATAGAPTATNNDIEVGSAVTSETRELGPITETAPDSGVFELDLVVRYTDGPASATCPPTDSYLSATNSSRTGTAATTSPDVRFNGFASATTDYCILQGDILTVEYTDPTDASGDPNTVTDSAAFDLRNGVLQSDKSVYIIGGDMILTLIEPDFDRENDAAETYDLDIIEWDSDAAEISMGDAGAGTTNNNLAFDPEPSDFRETGDSTGIFQIVIEIPESLNSNKLDRGEQIVLEYTDWGPSGADHVGDEDEDVNLTVYTSNFGATVELDQKVYTWTDKVYITIVAPDHNFDSDLIDEIGESADDPIKVSSRAQKLDNYRLVETGTDTGIFTGEVILTGFVTHDADGDGTTGDASGTTSGANGGPTDGTLATDDDDGITVSFEFSEDETVVGSALVRWNIGEVQWLEASYPATGTGVVRTVDPDMNLNPEAVDNFEIDVWSDSDAGGIDLTVTETNEATGIFEGTVFFTIADESSGHRLRVAEGDTITAEYEDNTLPDPYTTADELDITGTSLIGTIVPPLERAPAANARVVDAFGNSLAEVSVDQQVQITADLANGQDREQAFAYLVQVQDGNGVTVSLAWITGSLAAGQSFSPALSWIPDASGTYTATVFVWESVDNPTALSPPDSVAITVN